MWCGCCCSYKRSYGPQKEKFTHSLFLVCCQSIGNCAFSLLRQATTPKLSDECVPSLTTLHVHEQPSSSLSVSASLCPCCSDGRHEAAEEHGAFHGLHQSQPQSTRWLRSWLCRLTLSLTAFPFLCRVLYATSQIAFSYIGAMYSSNLALNYMSYPAQSLAKSCKMVPVMLMRIVVVGQRYQLHEYVQVLVITAGICSFMLFEDGAKSGKETSLIGFGLCLVSLLLDGFTGPTQERINAQHRPSMAQMMFFLNFWAILLVLTLLLLTGQLWTGLHFFAKYPEVLPEVAVFSLLSALGQAAILVTVLNFNSLILTTITTSDCCITHRQHVSLCLRLMATARTDCSSGILLSGAATAVM